LDVDAIDRDAANFYVAVGDILNEASSVEVGLDARAILRINNLIIGELEGKLALITLEKSTEYLQECS
jgi:hypothetical protein